MIRFMLLLWVFATTPKAPARREALVRGCYPRFKLKRGLPDLKEVALYRNNQSITLVEFYESLFEPKHSPGEEWVWRKTVKFYFSFKRDVLVVYRKHKGAVVNVSPHPVMWGETAKMVEKELRKEILSHYPWAEARNIQHVIWKACYPSLQHFPEWGLEEMLIDERRAAFRRRDFRQTTRELLGAHRVSKSYVRSLALAINKGTNIIRLSTVIKHLDGLVPEDYIPILIRDAEPEIIRYLYAHLSSHEWWAQFSPKRIMRLLTERDCPETWIRDTIQMWMEFKVRYPEECNLRRHRSWNEMHDFMLRLRVRDRNEREQQLREEQRELLKRPVPMKPYNNIDGQSFGKDLFIRVPENGFALEEWGRTLQHCLGSRMYVQSAVDGRDIFLAIYKGDELYATAEISQRDIRQLYGKYNSSINKEIALAFVEKCHEYNLIDDEGRERSDYRWGES